MVNVGAAIESRYCDNDQESEQWQSNGVENGVESESWSKYEVNVIIQ